MGKYIGNKRSHELHTSKCYWGKIAHKTEIFYSPEQALTQGYDTCGHCCDPSIFRKRKPVASTAPVAKPPRDDWLENLGDHPAAGDALATSNLIINSGHYTSWIHHNIDGPGDAFCQPTFTILNNKDWFAWDLYKNPSDNEAVKLANCNHITKIFIVLSGQQRMDPNYSDHYDNYFCRALTGGDRIGSERFDMWLGEFRVWKNNHHPSFAAWLNEFYGDTALVIDVLNCKYDYLREDVYKRMSLENLIRVICGHIYCHINHYQDVEFFICGYSRGAMMALELAEALKDSHANRYLPEKFQSEKIIKIQSSQIKVVVTIDPVVKFQEWPMPREERKRVIYWYRKTKIGRKWYWQSVADSKYPWKRPSGKKGNMFAVLRTNDGLVHHNVFQSNFLFGDNHEHWKLEYIQGCMIEGALSPHNTTWEPDEAFFHDYPQEIPECILDNTPMAGGLAKPYQLDASVRGHAPIMLSKYRGWLKALAQKYFPTRMISDQELRQGWYWGIAMKPGTPSDWVHTGGTSRSAKWQSPGGQHERKPQ